MGMGVDDKGVVNQGTWRRMWTANSAIAVACGLLIAVSADGERYPRLVAGVGVALVVVAVVLWWRRDWRTRYPELAVVPVAMALAVLGALGTAFGDGDTRWLAGVSAGAAVVVLAMLLLDALRRGQRSEGEAPGAPER